MRVPTMKKDLVAAVMRYNDGVYLHQSIVRRDEGLVRHVDLPDAVAAFGEGQADGEWRIHCHVPVFLADLGEISSTRSDLVATLAALRQKTRSSHLEVETYTWDVLPDKLRTGSKSADIAREIAFCKQELVGMNVVALRAPSAQTLLRLGRVSNLPTVWTNVIAGATIANAAANIVDVALVGLAMTAFYVGGMYLNDFFDRDIDARERPGRPIHAGDISAGAVSAIGFALLAVGAALLARFGLLTVIWGLALAGAIVLYDTWHKGNVFAPVIMGLCRALVYLATGVAVSGEIRFALIAGAIALAAHVIGLTYAAKQENLNEVGRLWPLAILAGPLLFALPGISSGWLVVIGCLLLCAADIAAVRLLAQRAAPDAVPRAVSMLIAAICLVDALAVALYGGGILLACICASGYPLTRLFQTVIPGT